MWRSTSASTARLAPIALLAVGCGGLASGDWRGDTLFEARGGVFVDPSDPDVVWPDEPLRVAVFWAGTDGETRAEQPVVVETAFPARYELSLHTPPPQSARFRSHWSDKMVAVGVPMLYADRNEDGRWNPSNEPLAGGAFDMAIVWAEGDRSAYGVEEGFQTVWMEADVCSETVPVHSQMFPAEDASLDLFVGDYWDHARDWNCDGSYDEWEEACPPESEMAYLCDDPMAMQDPFLLECDYLCP